MVVTLADPDCPGAMVTVDGCTATVNADVVAGAILSEVPATVSPYSALIATVVASLTGDVEAATVALVWPEAILTVAGVAMTLASELFSCTSMPPPGAGCVRLTVISVEAPPMRWAGLSVTLATPGRLISVPVARPLRVATVPEKLPESIIREPEPQPASPRRTPATTIRDTCMCL